MDGVHRTAASTDKTVSVDIEAECGLNPAGEDGIDRVEFYVSVNGGAATTYSVTARSERTYNSTATGTNGFYKLFCYGITVDCAALAGGTITVEASAFSGAATETAIATTLTIYNDTDGVDRRPSSAVVYYDHDLGDDTTGTGTTGSPVKTFRAAMNLLSGDVGGATIVAKGRTVGCTTSSSYSASTWSTSGAWALTVRAEGSNKTWQRLTPGTFSDPQDYILGTSGAPTVRMVFQDFEFVGPGPTLYVNGPVARIDEVNCLHQSHHWDGVRLTPHVDDDEYGSGGVSIALNGASTGLIFSWGGRWRAVGRGPGAYSGLFNFSIGPFLGVAIGTANTYGSNPCYTNGEVFGVRYVAGELAGLVQTNPNFSQLAGPNVTVSVQPSGAHTGKMRIEATNGTPNDFGTAAGEIVGSTRWGVTVSSATSAANNGTFEVLEGGLNGFGRPYCILDNASAVGEVGSAGFNMDTGALDDGARYIDDVHTDVLQIEESHTGAMFAHIRAYDCHNTRTWVGSGYTLTRCVFKNLTDGDAEGAFDFGSGYTTLEDCLFFSLSTASPALVFTGTFTGTEFVDCVWADGTALPTTGTYIHSNHYVVDSAGGTSPSTGSWFDSDPTADPYDYSPSSGDLNTASGLQSYPDFWRFTGATGDSRGAWRNVATGDWTATTEEPMAVYERVSIGSLAQGAVPPGYTFTRSTTALYVDSDGLLKSAAINTPRRQWDATNRRWGYVGEGARTNLLLYSEQFDNAAWITVTSSVSANASTSPASTSTADTVIDTVASATHRVYQSVTLAAAAHSISVYAKSAGRSWMAIRTTGGIVSYFNIGTGVVGTKAGGHTTSTITAEGNGWYRCSVTWTDAGGATACGFDLASADSTNSYAGDGTSGIYLWGAQLEAAPAPSSYIRTTTVAVTRGTDLLTRALTGPEGTALSTQGTMVVEFSYLGGGSNTDANNRYPISIDDGGDSERIVIYNQSGTHGLYVADGGVQNVGIAIPGVVAVGVVSKVAATWKLNDVQFSRDGVHGTRDTSSTMPTLTRIGIAGDSVGGRSGYMLIYGWTISDDHYPTDAGMDALTTPTTTRNQSRLTLGLGLGL